MSEIKRKALVQRLRNDVEYVETYITSIGTAQQRFIRKLSEEAADCIEEDGRQIAALKRRVEQLKSMFDTVSKKLEKAHTELKGMK